MVAGNSSRPLPPVNQSSPLMAKRRVSGTGLDAGGTSAASTAEESLASPSARRSRSAGSTVHWATSDTLSDPAAAREPTTPELSRQRTPSMAILHAVRDAIERHPSFAQKIGLQIVPPPTSSADAATSTRSPIRPGDESPISISGRQSNAERSVERPRLLSASYWLEPPTRAFWRHLFYVAIVVTLVFVGAQLVKLKRSDQEQREVVETALRNSFETALGPAVRSALTAQGALIAVNIVLAFRGVQIWSLIQRVKVVPWLQRIGWVGSWRKNRLVRLATAPLRTTLRGIMFPAKVAAERAAREAAAREAARRAARPFVVRFAERTIKSPYRVLTGDATIVPESVSWLYRRGVSKLFGVPVTV